MKFQLTSIISVGILALFYACSPATKITGSWTSPERSIDGYHNLFIAAIVDNIQARQTVENDFREKLKILNISSEISSEKIKPTIWQKSELDEEQIMEIVSQNGFDGILTMTLIDHQSEERYVPGTMMYNPMIMQGWSWGRRGTFGGYWIYHYPMMATPGYVVEDNKYIIEINLYGAKSELLIWSAQSKTLNPSSLNQFSSEFSTVVLERMLEEGILKQY